MASGSPHERSASEAEENTSRQKLPAEPGLTEIEQTSCLRLRAILDNAHKRAIIVRLARRLPPETADHLQIIQKTA
jgi:hypothetical protein